MVAPYHHQPLLDEVWGSGTLARVNGLFVGSSGLHAVIRNYLIRRRIGSIDKSRPAGELLDLL